jgi:transglutaminase-like putative cysteine protease
MRLTIETLLDYSFPAPAEVLLALEVAQMADQHLVNDRLTVSSSRPLRAVPGEESIGQRTWALGEGPFQAHYLAEVEVDRPQVAIEGLKTSPLHMLNPLVIPYLWPSRYCEAEKFEAFVIEEFGRYEGGEKVAAMADWIFRHLRYIPGSSDATTSAVDSFVQRQGVCRDYAHLMASFARAAGIPARCVSVYALDLEPQDFHAVVEVWLNDGWHLVDATRLAPPEGFVRIGVGRDATDISFMTIFGSAILQRQTVSVARIG